MAKTHYPISREFFPYTLFTPRIEKRFLKLAKMLLKTPGFVYKDPDVGVSVRIIPSYKGGEIELLVFTPKDIVKPAPCLVYIHGGGFVFEGSWSHYWHAINYAKKAECVVAFVRYRLAPEYPFPYPQEDCWSALCWVYDHADEIGVDRDRIGIGGDSAGGTLSVTSCMMARDRGNKVPLFQMLIYPWLDDRNVSDSYKKYTDTPVWNSRLSKDVSPLVNPNPSATPLAYRSPVEAERFHGLPPAYIEVAEFDSLHDDGIYYAELLEQAEIPVELYETKGTMHGFDGKIKAPTTQRMIKSRIAFMRKMIGPSINIE